MINPWFFLTLEPRHRTEVVGGFYHELGRGSGSVGGKAGCGASVVPALPLLLTKALRFGALKNKVRCSHVLTYVHMCVRIAHVDAR